MVVSDQQSVPKQLINEVPSHVVLVNNKVGAIVKTLYMKTLCKDVGSYCTCSVYDFPIGTLVWKVSQILSHSCMIQLIHLKICRYIA